MTPALDVPVSADSAAAPEKILVWDMPTRVFHWMMVLSFTGAYLTAESERWRLIHVTLGYTLGGLVAFRILWGLVGTRYARFTSFVRGPVAVKRYLAAMLAREPGHDVGHNPAGAVAIVLLLLLSIAITVTGWAVYNDVGGIFGGKWTEELHELAANGMLLVIMVHIAGVAVASWLHRENLVRAMLDGKKAGAAGLGIQRAWSWLAVCMVLAALGFWWLQWRSVA